MSIVQKQGHRLWPPFKNSQLVFTSPIPNQPYLLPLLLIYDTIDFISTVSQPSLNMVLTFKPYNVCLLQRNIKGQKDIAAMVYH